MGDEMAESYGRRNAVPPEMVIRVSRPATLLRAFEFGSDLPADPLLEAVAVLCRMNGQRLVRLGGAASEPGDEHRLCEGPRRIVRRRRRRRPADQPSARRGQTVAGGGHRPYRRASRGAAPRSRTDPQATWIRARPRSTTTAPGFTVVPVKILQIAPALHGAQMQSTEGNYPVVVGPSSRTTTAATTSSASPSAAKATGR